LTSCCVHSMSAALPRVSFTSFAPEQIDSILEQLDACFERLCKAVEKSAAEQPDISREISVEHAVSSVGFTTAALNLLPHLESSRDFMQQLLEHETGNTRCLLQTTFGGDCIRIAHIRSVVEATQALLQRSKFDNDNRITECLAQCKSVEGLLKDIGLGVTLGKAQATQRKLLTGASSAILSVDTINTDRSVDIGCTQIEHKQEQKVEEEGEEGEQEEEDEEEEDEEASVLRVSVSSASQLALPDYRVFDIAINTAHDLGADFLRDMIDHSRVYVELGLGDDVRITGTACSEPKARKVDWNDERHFFIYKSERSLRITVRDQRTGRGFVRGHPLIGEAIYEFPVDFSDGFSTKVEVPIARENGEPGGVVCIELSLGQQKRSTVHIPDAEPSRKSWKDYAGRTSGSEDYRFGDFTRALFRRWSSSSGGQAPN